MKVLKTLTLLAVTGWLVSAAYAEGEGKPGKGRPEGKGDRGGAHLESLLPPPLVEELKLTDAQKKTYDELAAAFKKEVETWQAANPEAREQFRKARESGDKEAMRKMAEQRKPIMDSRKASVDKLRATLTDEQKVTLEKFGERMRERHGGKRGEGGEKKAPKPAPAE